MEYRCKQCGKEMENLLIGCVCWNCILKNQRKVANEKIEQEVSEHEELQVKMNGEAL